MSENEGLSPVPPKSVTLFLPTLCVFVIAALLVGIAAGAFSVSYLRMPREIARAVDDAVAVREISMRVLALQNNVNTDPKSINYELLVRGLSSKDIGQRPDRLRPFGILTSDMRKEPAVAAASGRNWTRAHTK